jgi:hypothetical protein
MEIFMMKFKKELFAIALFLDMPLVLGADCGGNTKVIDEFEKNSLGMHSAVTTDYDSNTKITGEFERKNLEEAKKSLISPPFPLIKKGEKPNKKTFYDPNGNELDLCGVVSAGLFYGTIFFHPKDKTKRRSLLFGIFKWNGTEPKIEPAGFCFSVDGASDLCRDNYISIYPNGTGTLEFVLSPKTKKGSYTDEQSNIKITDSEELFVHGIDQLNVFLSNMCAAVKPSYNMGIELYSSSRFKKFEV